MTETTREPQDRGGAGEQTLPTVVLIGLASLATAWLGYELWRLVFQPYQQGGAVDLFLRWLEVRGWFGGERIYFTLSNAVYPPASYLMLWPFLGWTTWEGSRWLWMAISLVTLTGLVTALRRGALSGEPGTTADPRERLALLIVPLACYPVGASIGNGQLGIVVVLALAAGLPLLQERERSLGRDAGIAALVVVALIKPSLSAFFFWIVLLRRGGLRPAALTVGGYLVLTLLACTFQPARPHLLMKNWFHRGVVGSTWGATSGEGSIRVVKETVSEREDEGQAEGTRRPTDAPPVVKRIRVTSVNLHSVLGYLRRTDLLAKASFLVLGLLGLWVAWYRDSPIWILMGVTALVARFASYHSWYDDVLLLLPMVALHRIGRSWSAPAGQIARWLFVGMVLSLLAPGGIYLFPAPWNSVYAVAQSIFWLIVLAYLGYAAARERKLARTTAL